MAAKDPYSLCSRCHHKQHWHKDVLGKPGCRFGYDPYIFGPKDKKCKCSSFRSYPSEWKALLRDVGR